MKKHRKKKIAAGLSVIFLFGIASVDMLSSEFTSYAKENEEIFSDSKHSYV